MTRARPYRRPRPALASLASIVIMLFAVGCGSLSGYDAARYENVSSMSADASIDPDTIPLPPTKRLYMLDPRSPLTPDAGPDANKAEPLP